MEKYFGVFLEVEGKAKKKKVVTRINRDGVAVLDKDVRYDSYTGKLLETKTETVNVTVIPKIDFDTSLKRVSVGGKYYFLVDTFDRKLMKNVSGNAIIHSDDDFFNKKDEAVNYFECKYNKEIEHLEKEKEYTTKIGFGIIII